MCFLNFQILKTTTINFAIFSVNFKDYKVYSHNTQYALSCTLENNFSKRKCQVILEQLNNCFPYSAKILMWCMYRENTENTMSWMSQDNKVRDTNLLGHFLNLELLQVIFFTIGMFLNFNYGEKLLHCLYFFTRKNNFICRTFR